MPTAKFFGTIVFVKSKENEINSIRVIGGDISSIEITISFV
jgi:hypothetical protein